LIQNTDLTVHDIAHQEQVSGAYVYYLLVFLRWHPILSRPLSTAGIRRNSPRRN
jgi:hypothetical protein